MKISFSERIGIKQSKTILTKDSLTLELRNSLWTAICTTVFETLSNEKEYRSEPYSKLASFYRILWIDFYKLPIDNLPLRYGIIDNDEPYGFVRKWFFSVDWYQVYEFIEFVADRQGKMVTVVCNHYLKRELSAYRFVDGVLVEINSEEEIKEVETAINAADKFKPVKTHLSTALLLLSDKKNPDYRNSVKESISAVESLCKILISNDTATLGDALAQIEKAIGIPKSLKAGFSAIYGFTSDKGGIRHGLLEGDFKVEIDEARFMLIACSAFINYLISKDNR
jgi:hypothetical protein